MSHLDTIRAWKDEEYRLSLSEDRFRRRDMLALPAGNDQVLLVCDPTRHELVSRADFALLHSCTRFATIEAHTDTLARRPGAPPGSRELLRRRLKELAARGLLDRASLAACGGFARAEAPLSIRTVTIPTRNRPERERLAAVLASESGVPLEVAPRAVLGDSVHDWRPGAAYNVALLLTAPPSVSQYWRLSPEGSGQMRDGFEDKCTFNDEIEVSPRCAGVQSRLRIAPRRDHRLVKPHGKKSTINQGAIVLRPIEMRLRKT